MCGIAGVTPGEIQISDVVDRLRHRGPDDSGEWLSPDGAVRLGHTRLSVLDTSTAGHQPMVSPDGKTALVYNGEIYNYPELRKSLPSDLKLRSSSDTEVILHLYLREGVECFSRLNGMFALAVYDAEAGRLVLARDRAGQKPLYYQRANGGFAFASELQALRALPGARLEIDPSSLLSYLQFDYVPTPATIYRNVYKLLPGHTLIYQGGEVRQEPFWELDPSRRYGGSYAEACEEMDGLLDEAVRARLLSDVPLGVFLSGGLDSSTIASYAARHHPRVETFSIGFDDRTYDESSYAQSVADRLGTTHRSWKVTAQDMLAVVQGDEMPVDEPLGDTSIVPTYLLSRHTRQHVTVALGGDGGDELFAGYPTFQAEVAARWLAWAPAFAWRGVASAFRHWVAPSDRYLSWQFSAIQFSLGMREASRYRHQRWLGSFSTAEALSLLHDDLRLEVGEATPYEGILRWQEEGAWPRGTRLLYEYLRSYLMDEVLVKVDRASMAVSLEARSPFLDYRVMELAFSLPYEWKLKGLTVKRLLKDVMRPRLPAEVIDRPKKGFGMPVAQWLKADLRDWAREELRGLDRIGIDSGRALELLHLHAAGKGDFRKPLWNLIALARWMAQVHTGPV